MVGLRRKFSETLSYKKYPKTPLKDKLDIDCSLTYNSSVDFQKYASLMKIIDTFKTNMEEELVVPLALQYEPF